MICAVPQALYADFGSSPDWSATECVQLHSATGFGLAIVRFEVAAHGPLYRIKGSRCFAMIECRLT